jgi:ribosome biogenesis protein BMS1
MDDTRKEHRPSKNKKDGHSRSDAVKKKSKEQVSDKEKKQKGKAFNVANIGRTLKMQQRNLDRAQKKELVPLVDRTEEQPPPALVAVMGPQGCGKSTLIRSLVKIWTGQNLNTTAGPINLIAGLKRRITLFETPTDIHAMTDVSKVADLVLLIIDASYGFEMETFEFLNQLQLHGFPKVIGVLTNLDKLKVSKSLQKTKKALKHRFWTEIYKGAKMFDFTGIINGKYMKHEVKRLSLYISRVKFRPLVWRNTHPYVVADRMEDITPRSEVEKDPKCKRDITFYGYVRGSHLKSSMTMHLIGGGDFQISASSVIDDPCPLPNRDQRSSLRKKESLLYAAQANVGLVHMETDGTYINLKNVHYTKPKALMMHAEANYDQEAQDEPKEEDYGDVNDPVNMLRRMQDIDSTVDAKMDDVHMSLFKGGQTVTSSSFFKDAAQNATHNAISDGYDDESDHDDDENVMSDDDGSDLESDEASGDDGDMGEDEASDAEVEVGEGVQGSGSDDDDGSEDDSEDESDGDAADHQWKEGMKERAVASFHARESENSSDLMSIVYGSLWSAGDGGGSSSRGKNVITDEEEDDSSDGELFTAKADNVKEMEEYTRKNTTDSSRRRLSVDALSDWKQILDTIQGSRGGADGDISHSSDSDDDSDDDDDEGSDDDGARQELLSQNDTFRNRFVTGDWAKANRVGGSDEADEEDDNSEVYGDFEDLEAAGTTGDDSDSKGEASGNDDDVSVDSELANDEIDEQLRKQYGANKAMNRAKKEKEEDEDAANGEGVAKGETEEEEEAFLEKARKRQEQLRDRNKLEFGDEGDAARIQHEGMRQGQYVRLVLRGVPHEFLLGFQPHLPLVLGGLLPHEEQMGFVTARVKRHRWHAKILKANDPLIFSIGWRRFQTMPIYSTEDINDRNRYLKYTPEHMHCYATFYGPMVLPNTGVLAFQRTSVTNSGFRISLTGTALELSSTPEVVKKLKLVGTPAKIFRNTAFIGGMFNSDMEVAKFQGAKLKTVSGIRGQIKKAVGEGDPGKFRATFEDKIVMSDLVTCRLWVPVLPTKYYNPVTTLLTTESGGSWTGMRTVAQIRKDESVPIPTLQDSLYRPIVERKKREFRKLAIPAKLQEALPFASKPKQTASKNHGNYVARRAIVVDPEEKKKRAALQTLAAVGSDKKSKRKEAQVARRATKTKVRARETAFFADDHKETKKRKHIETGLRDRARANKGKHGPKK